MDGTNPLILFGAGILAKNPILTAIGLFGIVDPPDDAEKKKELYRYSNLGENQELSGYSNIGETQESEGYSNVGEPEKTEKKKRCVY